LNAWLVNEGRPEIRGDAIVLGCLLAIYLGRLPRRALRIAGPVSVIVLVALVPMYSLEMAWMLTPAALASAALVAWGAVQTPGLLTRILSVRPVTAIGRISYGLYLWHYPPMVFKARATGMTAKVEIALTGVALAFLVASLSWRFLEQPVMAWSRKRQAAAATASLTAPKELIPMSGV
jgi:peptidoglycan/LPS O-acetylase OafA/YrhL